MSFDKLALVVADDGRSKINIAVESLPATTLVVVPPPPIEITVAEAFGPPGPAGPPGPTGPPDTNSAPGTKTPIGNLFNGTLKGAIIRGSSEVLNGWGTPILGKFDNELLPWSGKGAIYSSSATGTGAIVGGSVSNLIDPDYATYAIGVSQGATPGSTITATIEQGTAAGLQTYAHAKWAYFVLARNPYPTLQVMIETRDKLGTWSTVLPSTVANVDSGDVWITGDILMSNYPPNAMRVTFTPNSTATMYIQEIGIYHVNATKGAARFPSFPYVNAADAKLLPKTGGTMTGAITLAADPTTALQAVTKQYVDGKVATDVQTFTASGVWTKPIGAVSIRVYVWASGAGGGSGARQESGTMATGGGGGGGGGYTERTYRAIDLAPSVSIAVGVGGKGGAAVLTDSTVGNPGTNGGASVFGSGSTMYFGGANASSGGGGGSSTAGGALGGGSSAGTAYGGNGAASSVSGGGGASAATALGGSASGAGAGGGVTTAVVAYPGGTGGSIAGSSSGGVVGSIGNNGGNGNSFPLAGGGPGIGGGGGGGNTIGPAGNGGNGGVYGGGGGGGGASLNGFASGAGGDGGGGLVIIVTYF